MKIKAGETTQTEPMRCTGCGSVYDAATGFADGETPHKPEPGAIAICIDCGHLMAFDETLGLRDLTDAEMLDVAGDPVILQIQRARVEALSRARRKGNG